MFKLQYDIQPPRLLQVEVLGPGCMERWGEYVPLYEAGSGGGEQEQPLKEPASKNWCDRDGSIMKYIYIYGITPFCASVAVYLTCRSFFWELWHVVAIKKLGQIYPSWKGTAFARRCTRKWNGKNVLWYCVRRKRSGKRTRGWGYLTFKREELGGRKKVNGLLAVWHMISYIHVTYIIYIQYVYIYINDIYIYIWYIGAGTFVWRFTTLLTTPDATASCLNVLMPRQLLQTQQFLAWNTFPVHCFWAWAYYSITNYRFICHRPEIYPILASKTSWNMILSLWGQATRQGPFFREFGRFNDSNRFILCTLMHVFLWGAILVHWHHQWDSHSKAYIWWHHIAWLVTEDTKWIQMVFSTTFHRHILLSGSRLVRHACSSYCLC